MSALFAWLRAGAVATGITLAVACSDSTAPAGGCLDENGNPLPVAPLEDRVDIYTPTFSNSTNITNPLFPIGIQRSAILLGAVDGEPFRVEVTLLPTTRTLTIKGQPVTVLESQYVAFINGRIEEVALDLYGQADDGSVWYFGEDVFNYLNGAVADMDGTWLAGRDGGPAMIMPANPQLGDVYRPENICGLVFEEVVVKAIGVAVNGPQGPIANAITVEELHMDGQFEDKTFAPGYGEFTTGSGANLEAVALVVTTDAIAGAVPAELDTMVAAADSVFDRALAGDWSGAAAAVTSMNAAWNTYRAGGVPPRLESQMTGALATLAAAVNAQSAGSARQTAVDVARYTQDFRLRYRPVPEIDVRRFDLWARQVLVDVAATNVAGVTGDAAVLQWIRDRFVHTLAAGVAGQINTEISNLKAAATAGNLAAAGQAAGQLRVIVAGL